jgi:hypothetical protein
MRTPFGEDGRNACQPSDQRRLRLISTSKQTDFHHRVSTARTDPGRTSQHPSRIHGSTDALRSRETSRRPPQPEDQPTLLRTTGPAGDLRSQGGQPTLPAATEPTDTPRNQRTDQHSSEPQDQPAVPGVRGHNRRPPKPQNQPTLPTATEPTNDPPKPEDQPTLLGTTGSIGGLRSQGVSRRSSDPRGSARGLRSRGVADGPGREGAASPGAAAQP